MSGRVILLCLQINQKSSVKLTKKTILPIHVAKMCFLSGSGLTHRWSKKSRCSFAVKEAAVNIVDTGKSMDKISLNWLHKLFFNNINQTADCLLLWRTQIGEGGQQKVIPARHLSATLEIAHDLQKKPLKKKKNPASSVPVICDLSLNGACQTQHPLSILKPMQNSKPELKCS